jgi:3D (Asp-Asp-Asp) domain-containing protein
MGYGTKVVVQSETVDGQTIEYWRKLSVYATSYYPGEFEGDAITRSGVPLTKGIVAVSAAWYPSMASLQVYVPGYGYGTIADSGYGIPGTRWIDLGYDDENYVGWHHWTTIYFLTPIPANIMAVLP